MAYQLVLVGSPDSEPSRAIEFPISKDHVSYESDKPRRVRGMRADAVKAIDELKPYKGGNDVLWRIHELDIIDKHRSILAVGQDWLLEGDWIESGPYWLKASNPHFEGIFDSAETDDVQINMGELLGEPKIIERDALQPTVHAMVLYVDSLVADFEPFLE